MMTTASNAGATAGDSRHRLAEKAGEVKRNLGEMAGLAKEAAREQIGALRDAGARKYNDTRDRLENAITAHPFEAVLFGFGIGVVACWLFGRRH